MPRAIVPVPNEPGESADRRVVPDLIWIRSHFKVDLTDAYASSGHSSAGEHPVGLGADFVPDFRRGGTWDDVDRLGAFAAKYPHVFGFVGYDGRFGTTDYPNHGRGDHLHLSWRNTIGGKRGENLRFLTHGPDHPVKVGEGGGSSFVDRAIKGALGAIPGSGPALEAGASALDALNVGDEVVGAAGDVAAATAKAVVGLIIDALGEDAARIALYPAFLFGGAALVGVGLARMLGVKPADVAGVATTVATRGAVKPSAIGAGA